MKRIVNQNEIVKKFLACPYCGDEVQIDPHMGCCGEVHHTEALELTDGEIVFPYEVKVVQDETV